MITVSNISVWFSGEALFTGLSFIINPRDRIGLVGKNGAGKSTLLKLITRAMHPDEGEVLNPGSASMGYLPQEMVAGSFVSVLEEVNKAFEEVNQIALQIDKLNRVLAERDDYESVQYIRLTQQLTDYNERYYLLGGKTCMADAEKVLLGLGFDREEFSRPVSTLSGGWRMRVELAKLLLRKPDLILLDEPTNHLDILSIQWLENYLKAYHGAVILVSHDRAFLDNATNRTIELTMGRLYDYKCPYSEYVLQREQVMSSQVAAFDNQQKEIKEIEDFIERFRYKATKAKQVQSRIKKLERIERISPDQPDKSRIHFSFPDAPRAGQMVYSATGLSKSFGSKQVLRNIDLHILRNDFVAFVGKNGMGKTTLSRIIVGELEWEQGTSMLGHNVKIGYYAQNQAQMLNGEKTVFETIDEVATGEMRSRVRALLGSFLFSGETIDKKVKVLSGGEKARLALAKMLLEPVNLLVLDEPTNHLDMQSKDILKNALLHYNGTLILVSHDRDFLQGLTNKLFEFRDHKVFEHLGDVYSFLASREIDTFSQWESPIGGSDDTRPGKMENKMVYEQKKQRERERRKLLSRISQTEEAVSRVEDEIQKITTLLASPDPEKDHTDVFHHYQELQHTMQSLETTWEQLNLELESFDGQK